MATDIIGEIDAQLASLNQLKPPGASKGKITSITELCVTNIQSEANIVQILYRALKRAPATHKLGALYVVDNVARQWIEKAKQTGQDLNIQGRGEPGTYPAAVKRVTELMPVLFDDIMKDLPADQKPKLANMIGIWEKGSTFPVKLLNQFKAKLSGASDSPAAHANTMKAATSTGQKFMAPVRSRPSQTPLGYPPQQLYDQGFLVAKGEPAHQNGAAAHSRASQPQQVQTPTQQPPMAHPPQSDVNSILAALANAVPKATPPQAPRQHAIVSPPSAMQQQLPPQLQAMSLNGQLPPELAALFGQQMGVPSPQPQAPAYSAPPQFPQMPAGFPQGFPQGFPMPAGFPQGFAPPPQPPSIPQQYGFAPPPQPPQQPAQPEDPLALLRPILPANIINDKTKLVMALNLLQDLQKQGLPMDQWGPILQAFDEQSSPAQPAPTQPQQQDGYGRSNERNRSRSPTRGGRGRASPVYGSYDEMSRQQGNNDRNGRGDNAGGRGRYRQRSPMPAPRDDPGRIVMNQTAMNGKPMQPKAIEYDHKLPNNNIKVLSRTLFVGGANGSQAEIQQLFERYGKVQTCIANKDKRHAFVKMTTRDSALAAKAGMEEMQTRNDREVMSIARQTKWGVGFGPRECCDYARGESIIPIHKLTEADLKWLLTAEYGGTGGKDVESGMVLEEPDIEIGAGVSSKAMSRRVDPETGAPSSKKEGGARGGRNRHRHDNHGHRGGGGQRDAAGGGGPPAAQMASYGHSRPEPVSVAAPPPVPTFGFSLGGLNNGAPAFR